MSEGKDKKKAEEILKMIREQGLDKPGDISKAFREIQQRQLAAEAAMGSLTEYPLGSIVGCAILYGIDICDQFGVTDGTNLIKSSKTASLIGVLEKLIEIELATDAKEQNE